MSLQNFIRDALREPGASYHVSRRLAEIYPARHIVEGAHHEFEIEDYAVAGNCEFVPETTLHNQIAIEFDGRRKPLRREVVNGWLDVLWRGSLIEVVLLTIGDERRHWIIADEGEVAAEFFRAVCEWAAEVRGEILVFERGYWDKDAELFSQIRGASFDDLILPAELKDELRSDLRRFFAARGTYERYRIPWKRGLLTGPPGNGKTGAIKALVNESGVACLYVKSFKRRFESDHTTMRDVFERARAAAPCLLAFEDLDSLLTNNNRSFSLNELDGFSENTGVVVLASTNHPERLDSSILDRPSRFDRKFHFGLPAHTERAAYFGLWDARASKPGCAWSPRARTRRQT